MSASDSQLIYISSALQQLACYSDNKRWRVYPISTGKNGMGEVLGSEKTPRGWHQIHSRIGLDCAENAVFVGRQWTGEIYADTLAKQFPKRDWILTRILQLDGLDLGLNRGGNVDSLTRYIYIHGTPDSTTLGEPGSHGCIRMSNKDVIELADWVKIGTKVLIC